jgi:hypothetical protein
MLKQFTVPIDFSQLPSQNFVLPSFSVTPASPVVGQLINYNGSGLNGPGVYVWDGTQWLLSSTSPGPITLNQFNHIELSHADLLSRIAISDIERGLFYVINDYRTYYDLGGSPQFGAIEPIIVMGTSFNTISNIAYSQLYAQDVMVYDINPTIDEPYGRILKRLDTLKNVSAPYDWRTVLFRRWNLTGSEVSGQYSSWSDTSITVGGNLFTIPDNMDYEDYYTFMDSDATGFSDVVIGELSSANQIIIGSRNNNVVFRMPSKYVYIDNESTYNTTFIGAVLHSKFNGISNSIISNDITASNFDYVIASRFTGIVSQSNYLSTISDSNFTGNHQGVYVKGEILNSDLGSSMNTVVLGSHISNSTIGSNFNSNTITGNITSSTIGISFERNSVYNLINCTIGDMVSDNRFSGSMDTVLLPINLTGVVITIDITNHDFSGYDSLSYISNVSDGSVELSVLAGNLNISDYKYAGIVRVDNTTTLNSINAISGQYKFRLEPIAGEVLTITTVPYGLAVSGQIIAPDIAYQIVLNGDAGDWIELEVNSSGVWRQKDMQVYV